jgi:hypothetical protein
MSKHKRPFDQNLVDAINKLCWPLVNNNGNKVFLRNNARYESGAEHFAGKLHELKVRDIELLPNVLKQPLAVKTDKRKGKLYFGRRKGVNKFPYRKVVVRIEKDKTETIITVCSSKRCT